MRDLPHLGYLQAFEAAARYLSFTRAAVELNCTQAAISQRIRGLEQHFGRPLFHRKPNGLQLSSAGLAYLPGITQALDMMEAATQGLTGRRVTKSVTVSAPASFINCWLAPQLIEFMASKQDISLRLNSAIWTDPNIDLADVSISVHDGNVTPTDALILARAPVVLVARQQGEPQRRIEVQGKYAFWDLWQGATGLSHAVDPPSHRVDNADTALRMVAQGLGQSVVYELYARDLIISGRLTGTVSVDIGHVLTLQPNPTRRPTAAARAFTDWLSEQIR